MYRPSGQLSDFCPAENLVVQRLWCQCVCMRARAVCMCVCTRERVGMYVYVCERKRVLKPPAVKLANLTQRLSKEKCTKMAKLMTKTSHIKY